MKIFALLCAIAALCALAWIYGPRCIPGSTIVLGSSIVIAKCDGGRRSSSLPRGDGPEASSPALPGLSHP